MTNPETYRKVAKRYKKKMIEINSEKIGLFRDFAGNLLTVLLGRAEIIVGKGRVFPRDRRYFVRCLKDMQKYFNLVTKFPEFREGEVNCPRGAFPDLYAQAEEDWENHRGALFTGYFNRAKQRLEEKASS